MMTPEEAYKYDSTFRHIVDLMRQELTVYNITPAELRQAALLAATLHESQRVKPLFTRSYFPAKLKCICGWTNVTTKEMHSATCQHYNWNFYHPVTGLSKPEHCHIFRSSGYGYDVCNDCGMSDVYYNWAYNKKS